MTGNKLQAKCQCMVNQATSPDYLSLALVFAGNTQLGEAKSNLQQDIRSLCMPRVMDDEVVALTMDA
ncbi:MAG: hypothetical protein HKN08_07720 [Gammaproteobacteria bacterium]|nr:hypothetical protein [Gammaproteobacteria bacterium]